jgi:Mg/Co/Ni transporter MgtE
MPPGQAIENLSPPGGADAFAELPADELPEVAEHLDPTTLARILAEMHPHSAAALLTRLQRLTASRVLAAMRPDDRVDVGARPAPAARPGNARHGAVRG